MLPKVVNSEDQDSVAQRLKTEWGIWRDGAVMRRNRQRNDAFWAVAPDIGLPLLACLVKILKHTSSSEASCERAFSAHGLVHTDLRNRLTLSHVVDELTVRINAAKLKELNEEKLHKVIVRDDADYALTLEDIKLMEEFEIKAWGRRCVPLLKPGSKVKIFWHVDDVLAPFSAEVVRTVRPGVFEVVWKDALHRGQLGDFKPATDDDNWDFEGEDID